jgi:hypothetical protein
MWPTRTRLLGAFAPNRRAGMIIGAATAAAVALLRWMNVRREMLLSSVSLGFVIGRLAIG